MRARVVKTVFLLILNVKILVLMCFYADNGTLLADTVKALQRVVSESDCETRKLKVSATKNKPMIFEKREKIIWGGKKLCEKKFSMLLSWGKRH